MSAFSFQSYLSDLENFDCEFLSIRKENDRSQLRCYRRPKIGLEDPENLVFSCNSLYFYEIFQRLISKSQRC